MLSHLFFFQAEGGIRNTSVTGVQTCALPTSPMPLYARSDIRTYKGIGVSPGIAIGRAVLIEKREARSEERRVGKEWRARWAGQYAEKEKQVEPRDGADAGAIVQAPLRSCHEA